MTNEMFKKEAFKKSVKDNVKFLYRKTIEEATQEQIFQAVSYTVKDVIIDNWLETQKAYDEQDPKTVYYMSMEFLMGRALGNNLINLCAYGEVKKLLMSWDSTLTASKTRNQTRLLETVVWEDLLHASLILSQH